VLPIEGDRCFQVSDDLVLFNQQPDLRNSNAEAARSAAAMEGIAKSLSGSAATAQQSLGLMGQMLATNNRIADDNAAAYITNQQSCDACRSVERSTKTPADPTRTNTTV
jgi:hypothetical protein